MKDVREIYEVKSFSVVYVPTISHNSTLEEKINMHIYNPNPKTQKVRDQGRRLDNLTLARDA